MNNGLPAARRLLAPLLLILAVTLLSALPAATAAQTATAEAGAIEPGVLTTPPAEIDCQTSPTASAAGTPADAFAIVSEESEARYRAQEELVGRGAVEAVGRTSAFIGQILFDAEGMPLACSRFDVDLRTLQSDEARRDNYLYNNTLETETYSLATFILTEVAGLEEPLADGAEATFTLIGNLSVHGVTRLVAWETTATLDGDTLEGTAVTSFNMPDFDITPPRVGPVVSLDETVALEVDIVAERAA